MSTGSKERGDTGLPPVRGLLGDGGSCCAETKEGHRGGTWGISNRVAVFFCLIKSHEHSAS